MNHDDATAALLRATPTWLLEAELARRRGEEHDPAVRVGSLVVDPRSPEVTWAGTVHRLTGRQRQVVFELALARRRGLVRVAPLWLAWRVWRGVAAPLALDNLRSTVHYLNRRVPGLVLMATNAHRGYGLDVRPGAEEKSA